jgi:DNA-binding beta-propeller fold protein YncE/tetratricopeptide (TPR) repeat protein
MRNVLSLSLFCFLLLPVTAVAINKVNFVGEYPAGVPKAIDVDDAGNIYTAQKDGTILVIDAEGEQAARLECAGGGGKMPLKSPAGIAYYGGNLYITDSSLNKVVICTKDGRYVDSFGRKGGDHKQFKDPKGIFVLGGVIYVADKGNDRVQVFGPNGVYMGSIGGNTSLKYRSLLSPLDVHIDDMGIFYGIDGDKNRVISLKPSGRHHVNFVGLNKPVGIAPQNDGVFIADNGSFKILKYDFRGNRVLSFGTKGKGRAQFLEITGIALGPGGNIYVSDSKRGTVQVFSEGGNALRGVSDIGSPPTYVKWAGDIQMVSDKVHWDGNRLYSIDGKSREIAVIRAGRVERTIGVPGVKPESAATDPDGFLWVVDSAKSRIVKLDNEGEILLSVGSAGKREGYFSKPAGIAISKDGIIYVSERGKRRIQRFSTDGVFIDVVGKGNASFVERPSEMTLGRDGRLYVIDEKKRRVAVYSPEGNPEFAFGGPGEGRGQFKEPRDIAVSGEEVFVLDSGKESVQVFSHNGEVVREFGAGGSGKGDFNEPSSLALKNGRELFISDTGNRRVQSLLISYSPDPPVNVSATGGMRKVTVSWGPSSGSFVESYKVYRSENKNFGYKEIAAVRENSFVDTEVLPGRKYFYRVSALAREGNESRKSMRAAADILKYTVPPPEGLAAASKVDSVTLTWKTNKEGFLSYYIVYRKYKGEFKELAKLESESFTDRTVLPDRTYEYRVTSVSTDLVESETGATIDIRTLSDTKVPVEIDVLEMEDVFSNTYKIYETDGIGRIKVTNNTREPISRLKVYFTVKKFMDFPTEIDIEELLPQEETEVVLKAVFNNRILSVTEDTPVQTEIKVTYYRGEEQRDYIKNYTLNLYEKHHLKWDVRDRIATFVTPKDPVVLEFARQVVTQYSDAQDPLIYAGALFDALGVLGVAYMQDPNNPYQVTSGKTDFVDYVQYPRETLKRNSGDCDDLVSLYSAALESLGIGTVLVDYPGHILLMFSVDIESGPNADTFGGMFVEHEGLLWAPVEMTLVGGSFVRAWESGSLTYSEVKDKGVQFVELRKAWERFKPATLPDATWRAKALERASIDERYAGDFEKLQKIRIRNKTKKYADRLSADPADVDAAVQLGAIYADFGLYDEAKKVFEDALSNKPDSAALRNNIGNVHFLKGKYKDSLEAYEAATALDPSDAFILVNLTRCYLKVGMRKKANSAFKKAVKLNKEVFRIYKKMSLELL